MELLLARDTEIPFKAACEAIGLPRVSARRYRVPKMFGPRRPRPRNIRKLTAEETQQVLDVLHSERFVDQTPHQVHAELLDEGKYIASTRTMYRILAAQGETKDRRNQRAPVSNAVPRLTATAPNQVWTWDISKLATYESGNFFNLYLVLDLFSRFPVAWMVAERENSALAIQLFSEAMSRHGIAPDSITVHNDRGSPMTSTGFTELLGELGAATSLSRPRVSNDNPFSESLFKTTKYQPDYPGRFRDIHHARRWLSDFFDWYANQHRHSGLAFFTPSDVFHGEVEALAPTRQAALDAAFQAHPERFVRGCPKVRLPPSSVSINPIDPGPATSDTAVPVITVPGASNRSTSGSIPS